MSMKDLRIKNIFEQLRRFGIEAVLDAPMRQYTSFKTGGPADLLVSPASEKELCVALSFFSEAAVPFIIIGAGTNLLVSDEGVRGGVFRMGERFSEMRIEKDVLYAKAGARLAAVCAYALSNGLTGLEFAGGIPGTVGGGVIMNAGAYDGELSEFVDSVSILDESFTPKCLSKQELSFGYRESSLSRAGALVLEVGFLLPRGDVAAAKRRLAELFARRREKQPLEFPSAGSTFKRPAGYFAGALIEQAALSGYRIGDAQVSEKHCGFLINAGGATSTDIDRLIRHVQAAVLENSGVTLECEVRRIGAFHA